MATSPNGARDARIVKLFTQEALTMQEIGDLYGVSRERVRQVLRRYGVESEAGGAALRQRRQASVTASAVEANRKAADAIRESVCQERHGCTLQQYAQIPNEAREAFAQQRCNALGRGVPWDDSFKLWQWYSVWQASGRFALRGRRSNKYVMRRIDPAHGYAQDNVQIVTLKRSSSVTSSRYWAALGRGSRAA